MCVLATVVLGCFFFVMLNVTRCGSILFYLFPCLLCVSPTKLFGTSLFTCHGATTYKAIVPPPTRPLPANTITAPLRLHSDLDHFLKCSQLRAVTVCDTPRQDHPVMCDLH